LSAIFTKGDKVIVEVTVVARSAKSALVGLLDGRIKIKVAAVPVEGRANAELIKFLAKKLKVPKSGIELVSGQTGKRKTLKIEGITEAEVKNALGF
jgi:uncharacterized protein